MTLLRRRLDFQDLEVELLVDQGVHVGNGPQVHVGAGQEGLDAAEIDRVAALDAADDAADDFAVLLLHLFELVEELHALGLVAGQVDGAFGLVLASHVDIDLLPDIDGHGAVGLGELSHRDLPFGLENSHRRGHSPCPP